MRHGARSSGRALSSPGEGPEPPGPGRMGGEAERGQLRGRRGRAEVLKSGERRSSGPSWAGRVTQDSGLPGAPGAHGHSDGRRGDS